MIKILTGILRPDGGTAKVLGFDVTQEPIKVKEQIGFLAEELNIYDKLTGYEFLAFAGRIYGLHEELILSRTTELLALLELDNAADRLINGYSYGMKKKIALAAALIHEPKVLFLDEPFNGIDTNTMRSVRALLHKLTDSGVTIFFSSHVMEVVEKLCDKVAIINHGKITATGTIPSLLKQVKQNTESWEKDKPADMEDVFIFFTEGKHDTRGLSWIS
jgi:ABC-2 type transport system ATP-binding protein